MLDSTVMNKTYYSIGFSMDSMFGSVVRISAEVLGVGEAACAEEITQQSVWKEEPGYGRYETRYSQREREAQILSLISNSYNEPPTTTFTKGYKVTLYSDSLRATALYANYRNGLNLGYQRG